MISAIVSALGGQLIDGLLSKGLDAFKAYVNKQITLEELKLQLNKALLETAKEVEVAHAEALAETYKSFMGALEKSKLMQIVWASVVISQLVVLVWYQWVVPALVTWGVVARYASAGSTIEWAYLVIVACLGMGPVVLRAGPAGPKNYGEMFKNLTKK